MGLGLFQIKAPLLLKKDHCSAFVQFLFLDFGSTLKGFVWAFCFCAQTLDWIGLFVFSQNMGFSEMGHS